MKTEPIRKVGKVKQIIKYLDKHCYPRDTLLFRMGGNSRADVRKIIDDAKKVIETEKNKAMIDVKNTLSELSLEIAEKIIKKDLSSDLSQKKYVEDLIKEINKSK